MTAVLSVAVFALFGVGMFALGIRLGLRFAIAEQAIDQLCEAADRGDEVCDAADMAIESVL